MTFPLAEKDRQLLDSLIVEGYRLAEVLVVLAMLLQETDGDAITIAQVIEAIGMRRAAQRFGRVLDQLTSSSH